MKSRTKSSSKAQTSKSTKIDIPEGTKWLLGFVNLMEGTENQKGKLNPPFLESLKEIKKKIKKLKKEQTKKAEAEIENRIKKLERKKEELEQRSKKLEIIAIEDRLTQEYDWFYGIEKNGEKTLFPAMKSRQFPMDKFKKWILKAGIPPDKPKDTIEIKKYSAQKRYKTIKLNLKKTTAADTKAMNEIAIHLGEVRMGLDQIISISNSDYEGVKEIPHTYTLLESDNPLNPDVSFTPQRPYFMHDDTLPQAIITHFLDFYVNQQEIHPYLRRCKGCGEFDVQKGKKQKFCGKKCRVAFHNKSRAKDRERKKKENVIHQANAEKRIKEEEKKEQEFITKEAKRYDDYYINKKRRSEKEAHSIKSKYLYGGRLTLEECIKELKKPLKSF